jgi:hypothetical protein
MVEKAATAVMAV